MAKNNFDPFVLLMIPEPSPTSVVGGGTGQSTTDEYACSYKDWQTMFARDVDEDGDIDEADYKAWFQGMFTDPAEGQEWWEFYGNSGDLFP